MYTKQGEQDRILLQRLWRWIGRCGMEEALAKAYMKIEVL